jgi:hypothetical protein
LFEWTVPGYCTVYLWALKCLLTGELDGPEIISAEEIKLLELCSK